jgi:selenocysteine lyase/cysteine desulfurase
MLACQRHLFEIPREVAYLDAAAFSALPAPVREAGEVGVMAKVRPWAIARGHAMAERVRGDAARLIGAAPDDVAIVGAVSQAIATAARNVDLPAGSRILRIADEFPSLSLVFDRLAAERGLALDIVERPADGDWTAAILAAIARPGPPLALAALTPLHWSDGALIDLDRVVPAVRAAGGAVVIDATQAVGVLDVDVQRLRPDFLAFPTYKWVLGPYSLAFLYAAPERQDGLPIEENGNNRPGGGFAQGARRYDKGEMADPIGLPMAAAAMELVAGWGHAAIAARLRALTDALADSLSGLGLAMVPRERRAPHILGVRLQGGLRPGLLDALAARGAYAADRLGVLRISPHVWADEADVEHFAEALRAVI